VIPNEKELVRAAVEVLQRSYSPYSRFRVGAALLGEDGVVYTGTNVENASFGLSICAERSAVFKAVSAGVRSFRSLAIASETETPASPCGACRQVLLEFAPELPIVLVGNGGAIERTTLDALIPRPFSSFRSPTSEEG